MTAGSTVARSRERTLGWPGRFVLVGLLVAGTALASADPFTLMLFATYALIGGFLAFRRLRSAIGWLLVGIGFGFISTTTFPDVDTGALARGTATTRDAFVAWLSGWSGWAVYLGFLALTIIFPTGRLRDRVEVAPIRRDVLATVEAVVRPSAATLWLRGPAQGKDR